MKTVKIAVLLIIVAFSTGAFAGGSGYSQCQNIRWTHQMTGYNIDMGDYRKISGEVFLYLKEYDIYPILHFELNTTYGRMMYSTILSTKLANVPIGFGYCTDTNVVYFVFLETSID